MTLNFFLIPSLWLWLKYRQLLNRSATDFLLDVCANLLTLNSEDEISHYWSQKATTYRQLLTQHHSFGIVFFLTNILQTDLMLKLCGVIEHSFIVPVSFWNFTTVVLVQNVKNLGGALVFIAYFIFLDHPNTQWAKSHRTVLNRLRERMT